MKGAIFKAPRQYPSALVIFHQQIKCKILKIKLCPMLQSLLVKRMEHRMSGPVGGRASPHRLPFSIMRCHPAERALIDSSVFRSRKRNAVVFEFHHRIRRFPAHVLDRILITQPIRPFYGIVHMPAPIVFAHVTERSTDATLRGNGMASSGENFGDTGGRQVFRRATESCSKARPASAYHDHFVAVVNNFV